MNSSEKCICKGDKRLIFACSGAADVGELADRTARKLSKAGIGKMYCLAGLGAHVPGIVKTTEEAEDILIIDGCPVACAKKSAEAAGINSFKYVLATESGMEKGKTPASEENIAKLSDICMKTIAG